MTDDLRAELELAAGGGRARPDVAELWRSGRRRRTARRAVGATAALVVVLAIGAASLATSSSDTPQQVQSADAPSTVDDGSCIPGPTADGETSPPPPPATVDELVHGSGATGAAEPTVVARAEVMSVRWVGPTVTGSDPASWYHVVQLQITDPVLGNEMAGAWIDLIDVAPIAALPADPAAVIESETEQVQGEIDRLQAEVDEVYVPLVELDEQIVEMEPTDPRYEDLVQSRSPLKDEIDASAPVEALGAAQARLQQLAFAREFGVSAETPITAHGPPCHELAVGDDVVVALVPSAGQGPKVYELASPSSFFLIEDGQFSPELDAARRSVPGWGDSELLQLAREWTPEQFLDALRQAAGG